MKKRLIIITTILLILGLVQVKAAGLGVPYYSGNVINLVPGETKTLTYSLQNNAASIIQSHVSITAPEWVTVVGLNNPYAVGGDTIEVSIPVKIDVPLDIKTPNHELKFSASGIGSHTFSLVVDVPENNDPVMEDPSNMFDLSNRWVQVALAAVFFIFIYWIIQRKG